MKIKRFTLAFLFAFALFIALNLVAAHFMSDCGLPAVFGLSGCADDIVRAGFPLQFYEVGGLAYHNEFYNTPLTLDIGISLAVSGAFGWWWANRKANTEK